ncbi:hypothetical protein DOTSEDRAFT_27004 [Dothistroma septosporum NZE10]|uniref:Uncharacterized protein n=1 Tax=Dothistroma septosporum (strain NZE10 / CBS 128990) TaxID=675120 RepID=N1PKQ7_DOTSN|nr:hypothetical protein DOTSEDRAFT_27004 [Dothistroma septosporum NZE10]
MSCTLDSGAVRFDGIERSSKHGEAPLPAPQKLASGLYPCEACGGYHYVPRCIYILPWSEWLAYLYEYMPSQLDQLAGIANISPSQLDKESLVERVQWLDRLSETHRPNYVGKSRMKADIMTGSTIDAYWLESVWQSKLKAGSAYHTRKKRLQSHAAGNPYGTSTDGYESEDDSSKIEHLKAVFARHLPRTSTATLFKKNDLQTVEHDEDGGWELVDKPTNLSIRERRVMASAS